MSERSGLATAVRVVFLIVAVVGLYVIVDNFDLTRRLQYKTLRAIEDNTREMRRLRQTVESGEFAFGAPAGQGGGQGTGDAQPRMAFHNSDLRDPDAQSGGVRVSAVSSFTGNLNTVISNEANVSSFWDLCNDSLGARNAKEPKRFEPRLAKSWTVSEDGKIITVHLRPRVYWHDFTDPITGKQWTDVPVTASDFAFYMDTIRNMDLPCDPIRNYYQDLDHIEVIDDLTFKVTWKETYFRSLEFTLGLMPYPRHLYRPDPETTDEEFAEDLLKNKAERNQLIIGCGPYVFEEYRKGERIIFRRNPNSSVPYPYADRIAIRQIKDSEKALIEFEKGALDRIGLTSVQWREQSLAPRYLVVTDDVDNGEELTRIHDARKKAALLAAEPFGKHDFEKFLYRSFSYTFIAWNMRKPLLSDQRVRLAFTHCIDRGRIIKEVFFNLGEQTTGSFVPHSLYYDHSVEPWPFDIERAKEILADAGWEDSDGDGVLDKDLDGDGIRDPLEWTFLMVSNHPYQSRFAPMIQEDMKKVGIRMKIKSADWSVYMEQIDKRAFDACSFYWRGGIESDPYQLWHGSLADKEGSSNVPGFKHERADAIMDKARKTLDLEKRTELYKEFHRILHREQPYTFLFCPYATLAQRKEYCNAIVYPLGMPSDLMWVPSALQRD